MKRPAVKQNTTRDEIIRVGMDIIAQQGFNTTGIDQVLRTAGVPKGSFYYYFPSKDDFGLAVIDSFATDFALQLETCLSDPGASPLSRIRNFMESSIGRARHCECTRGCLIGTLGQELASQNEIFRKRIDDIFSTWKGRFAACLEEARDSGEISTWNDPQALAEFILTGWEGAVLRAKVSRTVQPLESFVEILFSKVLR